MLGLGLGLALGLRLGFDRLHRSFVSSFSVLRGCPFCWYNLGTTFKEVLSVLMLRAPNNPRWPFLYHTKMADFKYFYVLYVFL